MISWLYSALFWIVALAWPMLLEKPLGSPAVWIVLAANAALAGFVIVRCSSKQIGFVRGIDIVAASSMSGCANITILYLPFLLIVVYLIAVFHSIASIWLGREHSQRRWAALVQGFHKRRLNAPLNPMTHLSPPDPSKFEIDADDPHNLLEAASLWEMDGEWEKAIVLYELAAQKLRGQQDGVYAENCIERIREKIARVRGG
jgi:hypothetical protein